MTNSKKMLDALSNQDLVESEIYFEKALKEDAEVVLLSLADELTGLGFLPEVKRIYEKLLEKHPNDLEYYINLAEIAIEDGDVEGAFDYLDNIPEEDENFVPALMVMADLYQTLDIPEVSEAKLEQALAIAPDEPLITFALAELHYSEGKYDEAVKEYARLNPAEIQDLTGISTFERIGSSYSMNGHFEKAVEFLEKALADDKNLSDDLLNRLGVSYLQLHDNQKGIMYLQQLRALNPHYPNYQLMLAQALQEEELLEEAAEVLKEGMEENPYRAEVFQFASENAYRLHDFDNAEDYLLEAIELDDGRDESLYRLTNLYIEQERWNDVLKAYAEMENQEHPYALWNVAKAQVELDQLETAYDNYEKAYPALKDEPDFLKDYALFLRLEGEYEKARPLLVHYLELEPADIEVASLLEDDIY